MFLVLLHYERPLDEIDRAMARHVEFLERGFRADLFVAAGRREPREGGVIVARSPSREALEALMVHDPFIAEGLARYEILEFRSSLHHPALADLADPGTRTID